jgi:uncharacterized protein YbbC (DUF1343 family)
MKHFLLFAFSALFISCSSQTAVQEIKHDTGMLTGAQQMSRYLPLLSGKRVGVVANQTSLVGQTHIVDTLLANRINVVAVFAPEHGFRGDAGAGEHIADGKDPKTGIPVLSLYGKTKKPTPSMLSGIDWLIFDIQDVGARFYTYISTLHYVLEAAAENNLKVLVLDRPNPNGHYVDGPVREEKYASFVGMHPIPIVHGLTIGELTGMILGEHWLLANPAVTVIPCESYTHSMHYSLPVRPSPNLPNDRAIALYPSLCWFEGTEVSVGRGTPYPFQLLGFPGCTAGKFIFTPEDIPGVAPNPPFEHQQCSGLDLRETPNQQTNQLELNWLLQMYNAYPDKDHFFLSNGFFDKLSGTASLRQMVVAGKNAEDIRSSWQEGLQRYRAMRKKYLLYPDFE